MIVYGGARNPEQWPEQARIAPAVPQAIDLTLRSHRETDRFGFDAEADVVTADGITFLQWRTSQASAEKRHSGTVPYTNADTEIWREIAMGSPEGAPVEGVPPVSSGATRATHSESAFQKEGGG